MSKGLRIRHVCQRLRYWAFASVALATSAAAQLSPGQIANSKDEQVAPSAAFQFGRTLYFNALVEQRGCIAVFPDRTRSAQTSFRKASARLAAHFNAQFFDPNKSVDISRSAQIPCDGVTLGSFEQKVSALTAWADRADTLKPKG